MQRDRKQLHGCWGAGEEEGWEVAAYFAWGSFRGG